MQSPGCCRKIYNPVYTDDYVEFTVTPLGNSNCLLTTETVQMKMIESAGAGETLCLVSSACRNARQGVYTWCRQPEISQSLLDTILGLLTNLLANLLLLLQDLPPLQYQPVSQQNCTFPENNCSL